MILDLDLPSLPFITIQTTRPFAGVSVGIRGY